MIGVEERPRQLFPEGQRSINKAAIGVSDQAFVASNGERLKEIHLRSGLILIYWYDEFKYPRGVERAKERLLKDLEFFK